MKFQHYRVFDLENTTGGNETYVYGVGTIDIHEPDSTYEQFNNIDDFMHYVLMMTFPKSCYYAHNGSKYDTQIILDWCLNNGFPYSKDRKLKKRVTGIITDTKQIYELKIHYYGKTISFRDTCLLVGGTLDKIGKDFKCKTTKLKGTIDYDKERLPGYIMDSTEEEYLKHDVLLLKEILLKMLDMDDLCNFLTAGSYAFHEYKKALYQHFHGLSDDQMKKFLLHPKAEGYMKQQFRTVFPELDLQTDKFIRRSYKGGYCINWSNGEVYNENGIVLDVNSLYPSCMKDTLLPYGKPVYFEDVIPVCDLFVVHILTRFKLNDGCLPFIQIKNSPFYEENEYLKQVDEEVELYLTSVDYELFHKCYTVIYEKVLDGYSFNASTNLFNDFVDKAYEGKKNAKSKTERMIFKIRLNSCYGRFGQRPDLKTGIPYLTDDGVMALNIDEEDKIPESTYVACCSFITAFGRKKIIESAMAVGIEHLVYIDTDSLHLVGVTLDDVSKVLYIDPVELGAFACESEFCKGRWVRQKTYIEENFIEDGNYILDEDGNKTTKIVVKACGLSDDGKKAMLDMYGDQVFDIFKVGLTLKGVKLMKHTVKGGCNLHHVDFSIK